jgi:hypothetical protein
MRVSLVHVLRCTHHSNASVSLRQAYNSILDVSRAKPKSK